MTMSRDSHSLRDGWGDQPDTLLAPNFHPSPDCLLLWKGEAPWHKG